MEPGEHNGDDLDPSTREFYRRALATLRAAGLPFLVGGAYSLERYTGIARHTKDLDLFVHPRDYEAVMRTLAAAGYPIEQSFAHWLGKVRSNDDFIDVIFGAGNGVAEIDDEWFANAVAGEVLGIPVKLCPVEETIWSKAFILERERYDGADVLHLLRVSADSLDWPRLLRRFGTHWRVLLSHLILFGFVYPGERDRIPAGVMRELLDRLDDQLAVPSPAAKLCRGTLISRSDYLVDVERWGYRDARLAEGTLTGGEVAEWTAAIDEAE